VSPLAAMQDAPESWFNSREDHRKAMSTLSSIREVLERFQQASGVDPHVGHTLIVDVSGANYILREFFFGKLPQGVVVTSEPDELVCVDGIPVKLRYESPVYGHAFIIPNSHVPARTCCDCASMATLMCTFARGATG